MERHIIKTRLVIDEEIYKEIKKIAKEFGLTARQLINEKIRFVPLNIVEGH